MADNATRQGSSDRKEHNIATRVRPQHRLVIRHAYRLTHRVFAEVEAKAMLCQLRESQSTYLFPKYKAVSSLRGHEIRRRHLSPEAAIACTRSQNATARFRKARNRSVALTDPRLTHSIARAMATETVACRRLSPNIDDRGRQW